MQTRRRSRAARVLVAVLLGGWLAVTAPVGWPGGSPAVAMAADPSPTPAVAGDTRSAGEGPGLVGAPLLAIAVVTGLGALAAVVTLAYVRLTAGRASRTAPDGPPREPPSSGRP